MIKIAYIVQCHKNAEQINHLCSQLIDDNVDIYLHIDKKWVDGEKGILKHSQVFFIPRIETIDVQWGNISQVKATLLLIENVLKTKKDYDYIWFISGQDFPIKSKKEIQDFLSLDKQRCFINITNIPYAKKRNEIYYPRWMMKRKFYARILKYIWVKISGGKNKTFNIFQRRKPTDMFYYGSCWWCLPKQCVLDIYQMVEDNNEYLKFFSHSLCPDESFFQTLIMQSKWKNKINDYLVYVDWSEGKSSPRILTSKDLDCLMNDNKYFFARKFDINVDLEAVTRLTEFIK